MVRRNKKGWVMINPKNKRTLEEEIIIAKERDDKLSGTEEEFYEVMAELARYENEINIFLEEENGDLLKT
jgi:hypothetical protein